jgi:P-type Ca2+ transporter type 2C
VKNGDTNKRTAPDAAAASVWHALDAAETLKRLRARESGLSAADVAARLASYGRNVLREKKPTPLWRAYLRQFESALVLLLIGAALVAAALGETADALAILAIVVLNSLVGFFQERRAEESLAALKRMTAPRARVRRDGAESFVAASEVVPGDVLELEPGDVVPADARLLEASALTTIEAPLTGESTVVEKDATRTFAESEPVADRRNMVFQGTTVAAGRASAVVVSTGMATEIGRIAAMLEAGVEEPTPLQVQLGALGRRLATGSLLVVAAVFVAGILRGFDAVEIFMTSVSLAVAAVPEGLPAIVTIALALGVRRMAKRRALVRRLASVETLGCASVVCSDKTGTLTVGEMTARALWTLRGRADISGEGYAPVGRLSGDADAIDAATPLVEAFVACNGARLSRTDDQWKAVGDPTEAALLVAGLKAGTSREAIEAERPSVREIPFSPERRRMTVVRAKAGEGPIAYVKGAPDEILGRCTRVLDGDAVRAATAADRAAIEAEVARAGAAAMRVLAAARREASAGISDDALERDLVFLGLAALYDPPRPEAA